VRLRAADALCDSLGTLENTMGFYGFLAYADESKKMTEAYRKACGEKGE
jgi:hypothetical protein